MQNARKMKKSMPLMHQITDHTQSKELKVISNIMEANPIICEMVLQDLDDGWGTIRMGDGGTFLDMLITFFPTALMRFLLVHPTKAYFAS